MTKKQKEIDKNLRSLMKDINKNTGVKFSYKKIYSDIRGILSGEEKAKTDALLEYTKAMSLKISEKISPMRTLIYSSNVMREKFKSSSNPLTRFSLSQSTKNARYLVDYFCNLIQPDYTENNDIEPEQLKQLRDWEQANLKERTLYTETPKFITQWDSECFKQEVDTYNRFEGYTYSGIPDDKMAASVADIYYKKTLVQDELSKHGRVWRFFHPGKTEMYKNYIRSAEDTLKQVRFDEKVHKEGAISILQKFVSQPYDMDIEDSEGSYVYEMEQYKKRHTPELHDARRKLAQIEVNELDPNSPSYENKISNLARIYDLDPKEITADSNHTPSFADKISPIAAKYGLDPKEITVGQDIRDFRTRAKEYDIMRNLGSFELVGRLAFDNCLKQLSQAAAKSGQPINTKEVLNDARKMVAVVLDHYTVANEAKELENKKEPFYKASIAPGEIAKRFKIYTGKMVSPDELVRIQKEAGEIEAEWNSDLEKLLREDRKVNDPVVNTDQSLTEDKQNEKSEVVQRMTEENKAKSKTEEETAKKHNVEELYAGEQQKQTALNEKDAPNKAEMDHIAKQPLHDRFFAIRFRPSYDKAEFSAQYSAIKNIKAEHINDKLPAAVRGVFQANLRKFELVNDYVNRELTLNKYAQLYNENRYNEKYMTIEDQVKLEYKDYAPVTLDQVKDLNLKAKLKEDVNQQPTVVQKESPKTASRSVNKELSNI